MLIFLEIAKIRAEFTIERHESTLVHATLIAHQIESLALLEIEMLGLIARWGHNVLLITMGVLTVAIVVSTK